METERCSRCHGKMLPLLFVTKESASDVCSCSRIHPHKDEWTLHKTWPKIPEERRYDYQTVAQSEQKS
jgi:hypothetical protein